MSSEFKMMIMGCMRKNAENRIGLVDMGKHAWVQKYSNNDNNNNLYYMNRMEKNSFHSNNSIIQNDNYIHVNNTNID